MLCCSEPSEDRLENPLMTIHKRLWVADESSDRCTSLNCQRSFSFTVRRHHCRICGGLFCGKCVGRKLYATLADSPDKKGRVRACKLCSRRRGAGFSPAVSETSITGNTTIPQRPTPPGGHDGLDLGGFSYSAVGYSEGVRP